MSAQTPVVLISCPNLPYFLGTFDTARFRNWWRSSPFPDDVENIKKGFHIYGRTHLAIAQRSDGRWAIYRSKNYGVDWERVFLAEVGEVIYDLVLITYGRAIMNTSAGFYETVKAGTDWTLVLGVPGGAPNAPAFYNIGGGDVLMCTDGRYIWRSTDIARSWSLVCDMTTLKHSDYYGNICYYEGPSVACIAGANGRVLASHGAFLVISEDAGLSFGRVAAWEDGPNPYRPPRELIHDRIWAHPQNPGFLITQLIVSSVDGPQWKDVAFLAKINDNVPVHGNTELFSWVLTTWADNAYWKPVFQQHLIPVYGEHLSSYDVAVMGASHNDKLVFSAQTRIDSTGSPVPSLKYSTDGGDTWVDVNLDEIKVGDPSGEVLYELSIVDDSFIKITWTAPPCNNRRLYSNAELYHVQCQSYEIDSMVESSERYVTKDQNVDAVVIAVPEKGDDVDAIVESEIPIDDMVDVLVEGPESKTYRVDRTLEGVSTKNSDMDVLLEIANQVNEDLDAHIWKNVSKQSLVDVSLRDNNFCTYQVDVIVRRDRLPKRLVDIERINPQFFDLVAPDIPYSPMDSRKEVI